MASSRPRKQQVILILNDESYYLPRFLDEFLTLTKHDVKHIFTVDFFEPNAKKGDFRRASRAIMPRRFVAKYLVTMIKNWLLTILPLPMRWRRRTSICAAAQFHAIPCKAISDVNDPLFIKWIKEHRIDAALSFASQIYRQEILQLEGFALYNFHPGILPRNKGRFPIFWAFVRDEVQGMTCHRVSEEIDGGEIICQQVVACELSDDVASMLEKITLLSPSFFEEAFDRIVNNNPQQNLISGESFYGPTPTKDQIKSYQRIIHARRLKV